MQKPVDTRITIENETSDHCTVVDVFTNNRRGLLYTLAKALARMNVSVEFAKIATYEDEAADVFYIQNAKGEKIRDAATMSAIREALAEDVAKLASNPRAMGF